MPLKPSLRAVCHYRALSAFTVYNRGGGRNSSVLGGFFWPSVGLLARTAGKSLKPWLLVNEGGLSTVPCCWFAIRIATRDSSRFVGQEATCQSELRFLLSAGRRSAHFRMASSIGQRDWPHDVRRYSTFGGTWG